MKDVNEYIESGVLEAYVMGQLSAEEANEVESYRKEYAEIDAEIRSIENALEGYSSVHAIKPPAALKETIWAQLEKEPAASNQQPKEAIVKQMSAPERSSFVRLLAAASVILLLGSLAINVYLYDRWKDTQSQLTSALNEKTVVAQDLKASQAEYRLASDELSIVRNPKNRVVKMAGLPVAPQASAIVYWDSTSGHTYIDPATLPVPPAGKQYQLWAIADGKPVDAGIFDVTADKKGIQPVKPVKEAQMFAVTLEPKGGVLAPNDASVMYVAGKLL